MGKFGDHLNRINTNTNSGDVSEVTPTTRREGMTLIEQLNNPTDSNR